MPQTYNVGVIVGSLRKESFNRKIARAAIAVAPASLAFGFIEIGGLPRLSLLDSDAKRIRLRPRSVSAVADRSAVPA